MNKDLERLRKALHPEKPMNIIEQCRIVAEALGSGGDFEENKYGLAEYLGIGQSKVYKMQRIHTDMMPEVKEWFMKSDYQANTAYEVAALVGEAQRFFLKDAKQLKNQVETTKRVEEKE